jgi:hypothetical protein
MPTHGAKIDANCANCKKPFRPYASEVRRGRGRCCSLKCASVLGNNTLRTTPRAKRRPNQNLPPLPDRLLNNVRHEPIRGCWLWTRGTFTTGYGTIKVDGRMRLAHRVSYETFCGPIPEGLEVIHSCDVPLYQAQPSQARDPHREHARRFAKGSAAERESEETEIAKAPSPLNTARGVRLATTAAIRRGCSPVPDT